MSWKRTCQRNGIAIALLVFAAPAAWGEQVIERLDVYPADIQMTSSTDTQRFIVVATRDDGVTLDVTKKASITLKEPGLVECKEDVLCPKTDGQTELTATFRGRRPKPGFVLPELASSDR